MRNINNIMTTAEVLADMWVEETGRHFLDSGDAYGRGYERAQRAVEESGLSPAAYYLSRPAAYFGGFGTEVWPMVDAFHHLHMNLEYDAELQAEFEARCDDSTAWLAEAEDFAEEAGNTYARTVNTYNYETLFNETLQWVEFERDHETYVLLQVHRGADVRGGYTKPRVFQLMDSESFGDDRVSAGCSNTWFETALDGEEVQMGCTYMLEFYSGGGEAMAEDGSYLDLESLMPVRPEGGDERKGYCAVCGGEVYADVLGH